MSDRATEHFHAAVDLGASSGRVLLGRFGADRLDVIEVHRFPNAPVEIGGELCWDVERLFAETLVGLARAVRHAQAAGGTLAGIGVDSWGVDFGLVTRDRADAELAPGTPAGSLPPVRHHRGADAGEPARAARLVPTAEAYAVTGVLEQAINTSYQLRSLLAPSGASASSPTGATGEPLQTLQLVPDLWVHLLTGTIGAERTIASTTQLLDQRTHQWSSTLIERWGLSGLDFPPVSAPGTVAGQTTPAVTERLGSTAPIPVYRVAGHDTASALAFARPGDAQLLVSSGSWSLAGVCLDEPILTEAARIAGFTNEAGVDGSSLLLRNLAGMWLLTECARGWSAEDGERVDPIALVAAATAAADAEAARGEHWEPPVFDVGDPRLLVPGDMPARITELCLGAGQEPPVGRNHLVRSIVESLAAAYAETAIACEALIGTPLRSVRIVGGGSRNQLLCRRTAERTGLPVTAGPAEASAIGNLAVQLVASGAAPTLAAVYRVVDLGPGSDPDAITLGRALEPFHQDRESA